MSVSSTAAKPRHFLLGLAVLIAGLIGPSAPAEAQVTAFKQAVAEAAAQDADIAAFYKANGYEAIWTGPERRDTQRRRALFKAIAEADLHGLPAQRYDAPGLRAQLAAAQTPRARGLAEVALSETFVALARDMQTGAVIPGKIDNGIVRKVPYRARSSYLVNFAKSDPDAFFRALPPQTPEYTRLLKAKLDFERRGGFGPKVPAKSLEPGQSGDAVVALRNRLTAMGYMGHSASPAYDGRLQKAVQQFQTDHGLETDGVAGPSTITEINKSADDRLKSIIVALERERWNNQDRGQRHVLVNITDYSARIIDDGKVTFQTRSVVGATNYDRRTPEFSDVMEHMVINPTWNVPRSIATKEYLPKMKRNPNAAGHLKLYDARGRVVPRSAIDFEKLSAGNFPFDVKQPPSRRNALGLVKFMFPNKYNIYLHDTPQKSLFSRETRAFSHGCVRLNQPFEFAYTLLARQEDDPKAFFHARLDTGRETTVDLEQDVPVHIIYRTAVTQAKGRVNFRRDVYGRDARIWDALADAGVALRPVEG